MVAKPKPVDVKFIQPCKLESIALDPSNPLRATLYFHDEAQRDQWLENHKQYPDSIAKGEDARSISVTGDLALSYALQTLEIEWKGLFTRTIQDTLKVNAQERAV